MFQKEFWISSAQKLKSTKYLALMGMFIAMKIVVSLVRIPISENLHLSLTFLVIAMENVIVGPIAGMVSGAVYDIVGTLIWPDGPWFFGYTLTAMLGPFIASLFYYRQKPTLPKIILARIISNYGLNVLLGSLWSSILYGKAYVYYAAKSLVKNTVYFPFQIAMIAILFHFTLPWLAEKGWIRKQDVPLRKQQKKRGC